MKHYAQTFLLISFVSTLINLNAKSLQKINKDSTILHSAKYSRTDKLKFLNTKIEISKTDETQHHIDYVYSNQNYGITYLLFITLGIWVLIFIFISFNTKK